jgi:hypothetical protein
LRVDTQRIGERGVVMLERARVEGRQILRLGPARHLPFEIVDRRFRNQHFRQRIRLRQERPMPDLHRHIGVHALPHVVGRHDVERCHALDASGRVERQPIGDTAAAVVAGETKADVAELFHDLDHGLGHRTLVVGRLLGVGLRHRRPAVAGQVGDHQREAFGERRRHAMPHHVGFGVAVQQQQRRPAAAGAREDSSRAGVDPVRGESGEQIGEVRHSADLIEPWLFAGEASAQKAKPGAEAGLCDAWRGIVNSPAAADRAAD